MFKGNGLLMLIAIVILTTYYIILGIRESKTREQQRLEKTEDSIRNTGALSNASAYIADSAMDIKYLQGRFDPVKEISFTEVDLKYGNRRGLYIREEMYGAFIKMHEAALKDGINLQIISATRNFEYQKGIWEAKWTGKRIVEGKNLSTAIPNETERARIILKYSSMPGTSRHHWGTDVDLNSMDPKYFETETGIKIYGWLKGNASKYGFCQPYTAKDKNRPAGYEEEKWHWSYMPLAGRCLEVYKAKVTNADIKDFAGCETAEKLKVIEDYVMGISKECK